MTERSRNGTVTYEAQTTSKSHGDDFDAVGIDVGKKNPHPPLNDIDQLVDAVSAALTFPVCLVQEERLEEFLPQLSAPQHWHCLLWKPGQTQKCRGNKKKKKEF